MSGGRSRQAAVRQPAATPGLAEPAPSQTSAGARGDACDGMTREMVTKYFTDPWAYSAAQADVVHGRSPNPSEELWIQTSWQMTARWDLLPEGEEGVKLVRKCAITSVTEPLQSVHVVAARREKLASGKWMPKGQTEVRSLPPALERGLRVADRDGMRKHRSSSSAMPKSFPRTPMSTPKPTGSNVRLSSSL